MKIERLGLSNELKTQSNALLSLQMGLKHNWVFWVVWKNKKQISGGRNNTFKARWTFDNRQLNLQCGLTKQK